MRRALARIALVVLALPALGGCAVSLFSDTSKSGGEDRITKLENRMEAVEKAAGVK